jgi:hypothetical protein
MYDKFDSTRVTTDIAMQYSRVRVRTEVRTRFGLSAPTGNRHANSKQTAGLGTA